MRLRLIIFLVLLGSGGCGSHVAYVHDAVGGIDLTVSAEGTTRFVLGYDSDTFALVPGYDDGDGAEAMTLVSVSRMEADGLDDIIFNHWVATGAAGQKAAAQPDTLRLMRESVFGTAEVAP